MGHKDERTLEQLFKHPISMNIRWSDVVHLFRSLGAHMEVVHGGREKVKLNGVEHTFHIPHGKNINNKDEIVEIRHFLERAGVRPPGTEKPGD